MGAQHDISYDYIYEHDYSSNYITKRSKSDGQSAAVNEKS